MAFQKVIDAETGFAVSSDDEMITDSDGDVSTNRTRLLRNSLVASLLVALGIACSVGLIELFGSSDLEDKPTSTDSLREAQAVFQDRDIAEYLASDLARAAAATGKEASQTGEEALAAVAQDTPQVSHDIVESPVQDCHMSAWEQCSIANMQGRATFTNVFPGGKTRCMLSTNKDYSFQVIPGDMDKLLIYFQGGGSCWDEGSTKMKLCSTNVWVNDLVGIFDRNSPGNPYQNYTIVHIGYCSGDAHSGDVKREYTGPDGAQVEQRGFQNALAAVNWAKANLGGKELESFVIAGTSAGSLAAQLWARRLLSDFSYESAAVLADSYIGVFPSDIQGSMQKYIGVCNTGLLSDHMMEHCNAGNLTVEDTYSEVMSSFPDVVFASINSKTDAVQMAFYDAVQLSLLGGNSLLSPADFYKKMATVQGFYSRHPNHINYDVGSMNHTYINQGGMFTTSVDGVPLNVWLSGLPVRPGGSIESKCDGLCVPETNKNKFSRLVTNTSSNVDADVGDAAFHSVAA